MRTSDPQRRWTAKTSHQLAGWLVAVTLSITAHTVSATTFLSVEPVPNRDVVGEQNLISDSQHRLRQSRAVEPAAPRSSAASSTT